MINTEIQHSTGREEYPCLKADKSGAIILFTERYTGTVVHTGESIHHIGDYNDEWPEKDFIIFHGQVILGV